MIMSVVANNSSLRFFVFAVVTLMAVLIGVVIAMKAVQGHKLLRKIFRAALQFLIVLFFALVLLRVIGDEGYKAVVSLLLSGVCGVPLMKLLNRTPMFRDLPRTHILG